MKICRRHISDIKLTISLMILRIFVFAFFVDASVTPPCPETKRAFSRRNGDEYPRGRGIRIGHSRSNIFSLKPFRQELLKKFRRNSADFFGGFFGVLSHRKISFLTRNYALRVFPPNRLRSLLPPCGGSVPPAPGRAP